MSIEILINVARWNDEYAERLRLVDGDYKRAARIEKQATKLWAKIFGEDK